MEQRGGEEGRRRRRDEGGEPRKRSAQAGLPLMASARVKSAFARMEGELTPPRASLRMRSRMAVERRTDWRKTMSRTGKELNLPITTLLLIKWLTTRDIEGLEGDKDLRAVDVLRVARGAELGGNVEGEEENLRLLVRQDPNVALFKIEDGS